MANVSSFLLVEDSADDVLLMRRAFLKANILNPLVVVRSGEEAIQYLSADGAYANRQEFPLPSVILLDLKLSGKSGFDVLEWIRSQPGMRTLRVIVLTSSDSIYDVDRAYKLGANSFIVKPVRFEALVEIMQSIRGYWMWFDTAPTPTRPEPLPKHSGDVGKAK
jgi:CheY-like chemotaxis protein